jgi:hypothetical protein
MEFKAVSKPGSINTLLGDKALEKDRFKFKSKSGDNSLGNGRDADADAEEERLGLSNEKS